MIFFPTFFLIFHSDGTFQVVDYCPRNLVQMSELLEEEGSGNMPRLPYGMSHAKNLDLKQVVLFTLLQNHEHKTIEWLLTFPTEAEKSQWIQLVTPDTTSPENPGEKIYQDWDCPLVEAVASIQPEASNEIPLQKGEKANVLRKLSDSGMYGNLLNLDPYFPCVLLSSLETKTCLTKTLFNDDAADNETTRL